MAAMFEPHSLRLFRCPFTHSPLEFASADELEQINHWILERRLTTRLHTIQAASLEGAILNQDRSWAFPIHDEIPNLGPDSAIRLEGFARQASRPIP